MMCRKEAPSVTARKTWKDGWREEQTVNESKVNFGFLRKRRVTTPLPACHHNHNNNPASDNDHDNEGIKSTPDTTLCLGKEKATL